MVIRDCESGCHYTENDNIEAKKVSIYIDRRKQEREETCQMT